MSTYLKDQEVNFLAVSLPEWSPLTERPIGQQHIDLFPAHQRWVNSRYDVFVRFLDEEAGVSGPIHISLKNHWKEAVHDWRDMQRIKNVICGPEREAIEIFPAESRLVDTSNQYHLWVLPEGVALPLGFQERLVSEDSVALNVTGMKTGQRPWPDDSSRPKDLLSPEQINSLVDETFGGG